MKGVFVDIETTGLNFKTHVPLDIAVSIVDLSDITVLETYSSLITCSTRAWDYADDAALRCNGYDIDNHFPSKGAFDVGIEIENLFRKHEIDKGKAVFICQNPSFDKFFFGMIVDLHTYRNIHLPYHWLDLASMYWIKFYGSCYPVPEALSLSKDSIAAAFGLPTETKPHKALGGVAHLILCYKAVVHNMSCRPREPVIYQGFKEETFRT